MTDTTEPTETTETEEEPRVERWAYMGRRWVDDSRARDRKAAGRWLVVDGPDEGKVFKSPKDSPKAPVGAIYDWTVTAGTVYVNGARGPRWTGDWHEKRAAWEAEDHGIATVLAEARRRRAAAADSELEQALKVIAGAYGRVNGFEARNGFLAYVISRVTIG